MQRVPVTSSNIASIGYNDATRTLEIEFKNGGVYQYLDVPPAEYASLMDAESHGSYWNKRKAQYQFKKLETV